MCILRYIYTWIEVYIDVYVYVYIEVYIYVYIEVCIEVYIDVYIEVYIEVYMLVYIEIILMCILRCSKLKYYHFQKCWRRLIGRFSKRLKTHAFPHYMWIWDLNSKWNCWFCHCGNNYDQRSREVYSPRHQNQVISCLSKSTCKIENGLLLIGRFKQDTLRLGGIFTTTHYSNVRQKNRICNTKVKQSFESSNIPVSEKVGFVGKSSLEAAIWDFPLPVSSRLVVQHCHYSNWTAGSQKRRHSRWNCVAKSFVQLRYTYLKLEVAILEYIHPVIYLLLARGMSV